MEYNNNQKIMRKKKQRQIIIKIIYLLSGITIIVGSSVYAVIASTLAQERFFAILSPIAGGITCILFFIFLFWRNKRLTVIVVFILFLILTSLVIGLRVVFNAWHNREKNFFLNDVDIMEYIPFTGEKIVRNYEPASIEIEKDFPALDGSAALYPLYSAFAQALNPKFTDDGAVIESDLVKANNNPAAFENLLSGEADIIFVENLSEAQLEEASVRGIELNMIPLGREAFVFLVNKDNPVVDLTIKQLQDIYSGRIKNWSKVGGKNERIIAFQRVKNSSGQNALEDLMKKETIIKVSDEEIVSGIGGVIKKVADHKNYNNSIGFSFRFFLSGIMEEKNIKILHIDGIYPSEASIKDALYPLTSHFYAVTADSKNPNIDKFINWILSDEGRQIMEKIGYVPLGKILKNDEHVKTIANYE